MLAAGTPTRFRDEKMSDEPTNEVQAKACNFHQTVSSYVMLLNTQQKRLFFFSTSMITEAFPSAERDASALLSTSVDKSLFKQDGKSQFALGHFFQEE